MKIIIYPNESGGIAIITPAVECDLTLEQIAKKDVPTDSPYKIIDEKELPIDRTYRKAWEADFVVNDSEISVNLEKAKDVKRDLLRAERQNLMGKLDIEVIKNINNQECLFALEELKQKLRDAPAHESIQNASSIEELNKITLSQLCDNYEEKKQNG